MKAHPDAVGSNRLIEKFLAFSSDYESAKVFLVNARGESHLRHCRVAINDRLEFFRCLYCLELMDKPYSFRRDDNKQVISRTRKTARSHFLKWKPGYADAYVAAEKEYDTIKAEKPSGPYMKDALAINVNPIFHNIVAYQLTGMDFYRRQVRQNLKAVMKRLSDRNLGHLRGHILLLIRDMENGPAVFGEDAPRQDNGARGSREYS